MERGKKNAAVPVSGETGGDRIPGGKTRVV